MLIMDELIALIMINLDAGGALLLSPKQASLLIAQIKKLYGVLEKQDELINTLIDNSMVKIAEIEDKN